MGFFATQERLFLKTPLRFLYLGGFIMFFILTEIGRKIYRPWIFHNHINDFGIAGTIGNSLGTMTLMFLLLGLYNCTTIQSYRIIGSVALGIIGYEFAQTILPRGTFDWGDVFATIGAGIFSAIIVTLVHFLYSRNQDKKSP